MAPFALMSGAASAAAFGITPSMGVGVEQRASSDRIKFRRDLVARATRRGAVGQEELRSDLARAMYAPADESVKRRASGHWLSRILDTTNTYGGNIDR